MQRELDHLLAYLDHAQPNAPQHWHDWQIQLIAGGQNNRRYQALKRATARLAAIVGSSIASR